MKSIDVVCIPSKPKMILSEIVYFYMLSLVGNGKLTRRDDIEKYLAESFEVQCIEFERPINFDSSYWYKLIDKTPFHREVSSYGYTNEVHRSKLLQEGFELVESKTTKGRTKIKVKDYKKYLIDFKREVKVDLDMLKRINVEKNF